MMKYILLIVMLIFLTGTTVYGVMPSKGESKSVEASKNRVQAEISQERERIIKNIIPVRKMREKNLHPFVQDAEEGEKNIFDDATKKYAATEQENRSYNPKGSSIDNKPSPVVDFILISIILAGFLLSYLFIRPKSR